jgi:hypothetical protein
VRHLYAPLEVTLLGQRDAMTTPTREKELDWIFEVRNLASFQDLSWLAFDWELLDSTGVVASGAVELAAPATPAGSATTASFAVPVCQRICQTYVTVSARSKADGRLVKATQFKVASKFDRDRSASSHGPEGVPIKLSDPNGGISSSTPPVPVEQLVSSRDSRGQILISAAGAVRKIRLLTAGGSLLCATLRVLKPQKVCQDRLGTNVVVLGKVERRETFFRCCCCCRG